MQVIIEAKGMSFSKDMVFGWCVLTTNGWEPIEYLPALVKRDLKKLSGWPAYVPVELQELLRNLKTEQLVQSAAIQTQVPAPSAEPTPARHPNLDELFNFAKREVEKTGKAIFKNGEYAYAKISQSGNRFAVTDPQREGAMVAVVKTLQEAAEVVARRWW